ncbi:MAG: hypothetical protein IPF58_12525 [Saprospirales bacterium]|nr:hypothetical protein [Saprospirales bacterium]
MHFISRSIRFERNPLHFQFFKAILNIDGTTHEALLKDVQAHPLTEQILHIDFSQKLTPGVKVIVEIPIKVVGFFTGVKEGLVKY